MCGFTQLNKTKQNQDKVENIINFENVFEKKLPIHVFMSLNFIQV